MTDRLDEIRALLASVTPGRWRWQDHGNGMYLGSDEDVVVGTITRYVGVSDVEVVDVEPFEEADAQIIAAAPELLAWAVGEIERLRADVRGDALPLPHLDVDGCVFHAQGEVDGVSWSIRAEAETNDVARCAVRVGGRAVADVSVHADGREQLPEECQTICSALVRSALRALRLGSSFYHPPVKAGEI